MYLIGTNSIRHPWIIPKDFPTDALSEVHRDKLTMFIDNYNASLQWSSFERISFLVISVLYYAISKPYHTYLRQQKFHQLRAALYRAFPPQFWGDNNNNNKTIRLGCSKDDYQLAYIDFIDFSKTKETWPGVKLPMSILCSGSGTFSHPYKVDFIEDTYAKSIALINLDYFREKLPPFLENFNSQLSKLSFYKLQEQVMSDLYNVIKWIERANKTMFNHFNVKCVLYICENTTYFTKQGVFNQQRKSFPLESIFVD